MLRWIRELLSEIAVVRLGKVREYEITLTDLLMRSHSTKGGSNRRWNGSPSYPAPPALAEIGTGKDSSL